MRYRESDCVGCEHCVNCGRRNGYMVYECDICAAEFTDPDEITSDSGKDYCWSCYEKEFGEED